jgi:hypothetical protein
VSVNGSAAGSDWTSSDTEATEGIGSASYSE